MPCNLTYTSRLISSNTTTATANKSTHRVLLFICGTYLYTHPAQSIDLSVFAHGGVTLHFHTFSCTTIKTTSIVNR